MPRLKHELVLRDFDSFVAQSRSLVLAARQWLVPTQGPSKPRFTVLHQTILVEFAFLRSYLAWERFLEECFILYLLGKKPSRRRRAPRCFVSPNNWNHAFELLLPETGRHYVDWDNVELVRKRASRLFADGEPFESALTPRLNLFQEMQVVRNAIAHRSLTSQANFEHLVRRRIGHIPAKLTAGAFLERAMAGVRPPITHLDSYLDGMARTARAIVP